MWNPHPAHAGTSRGTASSAAASGGDVNWVFLGPPGVGKGTYASRIAKALGVAHIAAGDLVRAEIKSGSGLGEQVGAPAQQPAAAAAAVAQAWKRVNTRACDGRLVDGPAQGTRAPPRCTPAARLRQLAGGQLAWAGHQLEPPPRACLQMKAIVNQGKLLPDDIIIEVSSARAHGPPSWQGLRAWRRPASPRPPPPSPPAGMPPPPSPATCRVHA